MNRRHGQQKCLGSQAGLLALLAFTAGGCSCLFPFEAPPEPGGADAGVDASTGDAAGLDASADGASTSDAGTDSGVAVDAGDVDASADGGPLCGSQGACIPGVSLDVDVGACEHRLDLCDERCAWVTGEVVSRQDGDEGLCSPGETCCGGACQRCCEGDFEGGCGECHEWLVDGTESCCDPLPVGTVCSAGFCCNEAQVCTEDACGAGQVTPPHP